MAQEIFSTDYSQKFVDIHASIKIGIEFFLSKLLFGGSLKDVIYATPDIAFRRRIELLDQGRAENEEIRSVSLKLPFASYCQTTDVDADDRAGVQQAAPAIEGVYHESLSRKLNWLDMKVGYEATIYCNRRDMVRYFQQLLYWEQKPNFPIKLKVPIIYHGFPLDIPTFLTIEKIETDITYKETELLEKARIFPMKVTFTVRSYQLLIPSNEAMEQLPIRFSNFSLMNRERLDDTIYYAEEAVLDWAIEKFDLARLDEGKKNDSDEYVNFAEKFFKDDAYTDKVIDQLGLELMNDETIKVVRGYFTETTESTLDYFRINYNKSSSTSLYLEFQVKPADRQYFDYMMIYVPGHEDIRISDCHLKGIEINGLYPNSTYNLKIVVFDISGTALTYTLDGTTLEDPKDENPTPEKINVKGKGYLGMEF